MYLEKIEIQGFKSFAKKTILQFAHEVNSATASAGKAKDIGLTVIVGPNGSGKSNIADAVRWVLGEQSVKLLRGKKSEDVIFSGSYKKSSLSFAEVSLYLNNESKKAPIDYTELAVTRRLYRDGETEYLINGNRVRLLDVQLLLAKARFGQRAYSVVGQGMVENFLNTTPAERKEFFDEATGVKMYQIKKHDAENKLSNARGNLEQAEQLLLEIEPRLKSLTRQIKKLEQRSALEEELKTWQTNYYAQAWHELSQALHAVNTQVVKHEESQRALSKELHKLNTELNERERALYDVSAREQAEALQERLRRERDALNQQLADIRARKNVSLELAGRGDEAWLRRRADELERLLSGLRADLERASEQATEANKEVVAVRKDQNGVEERIIERRREIISYHSGARDSTAVVQKIREALTDIHVLHDDIAGGFAAADSLETLKKKFGELGKKIRALAALTGQEWIHNDADLEKINTEIINLEEEKNILTERYISAQTQAASRHNTIAQLQERKAEMEAELAQTGQKLKAQSGSTKNTDKDLVKREQDLLKQLAALDGRLADNAQALHGLQAEYKKQRDVIMNVQKKTQALQNEYNQTTAALGAVQVEKARVETRLEDLENEIRRETGNLRAVMDCKQFKKVDEHEAQSTIQRVKRQLELIGGIDPEIQKEYTETKERFEFLSKQSTDLRAAITALQKIITSLEKTITEKFDRAFGDIAKQFEKYFKILFDGGAVKLEKILEEEKKPTDIQNIDDEENSKIQNSEFRIQNSRIVLRETKKIFTGIDVMACPPHKKIKHISSLSGGERALTSIALIAAIIAVNPSPFVMLDEVDAALDEANSTRLAKILEDLSKKTQFIAITHNRTIMYKADIIYGVTMGDDGVSKLLSVKVEDVQAARR